MFQPGYRANIHTMPHIWKITVICQMTILLADWLFGHGTPSERELEGLLAERNHG
jgi:hypothetical protein